MAQNREKQREYERLWREKNRKRINSYRREYSRRYRQANLVKRRAYERALYRKRRAAAGLGPRTKKDPEQAALYVIWWGMKQRCDPRSASSKYYFDRGIGICARWLESFSDFLADMGPRPSPRHTIERINNDGNYEPSNCRWATRAEQAVNTRKTVWVEFRGEKRPLREWAKILGINYYTLWGRYKKCGVDGFDRPAINTGVRFTGKKLS